MSAKPQGEAPNNPDAPGPRGSQDPGLLLALSWATSRRSTAQSLGLVGPRVDLGSWACPLPLQLSCAPLSLGEAPLCTDSSGEPVNPLTRAQVGSECSGRGGGHQDSIRVLLVAAAQASQLEKGPQRGRGGWTQAVA